MKLRIRRSRIPPDDYLDGCGQSIDHPFMSVKHGTSWAILPVLLPTILLIVMAISHRWITDDAFIDARVVNNIVAGHGPVFNVGERVEAYTDPLWVLILSIVRITLPFVTTEWAMLILGVSFTTLGILLGSLATIQFARPGSRGLVLPVGAIVAASIDAMWWFSSSGLETGLLFGWLGVSWWMLVHVLQERKRHPPTTSAALFGLGFLIRPDAGLISMSFFASLVLIESRTIRLSKGNVVALAASFIGLPVVSEIFRVAYFGLLVPNTALAKSGFSLEPSQGVTYLEDFLHSSDLWIPCIILGAVMFSRLVRWWHQDLRLEAMVLALVALGAMLDVLYVVAIGGDFMHARMLLPGFLLLALISWFDIGEQLERRLPLAALLIWAAMSLLFFRYPPTIDNRSGITNERQAYITLSQNAHPVDLGDFEKSWNFHHGHIDRLLAARQEKVGTSTQVVSACQCGMSGPRDWSTFDVVARSKLPERVFANAPSIGIWGVEAGPKVYIFDNFGLANPIGSHFELIGHRVPGVADLTDNTWMLARFARPAQVPSALTPTVNIERKALTCQPLSSYMRAIDAPLSWSVIWGNFKHSLTWTTMKFPSDPQAAEKRLCK